MIMNKEPLKVYLAEGGIFYILRWHSHNEGNHILVTRQEKSLKRLLLTLCQEYSDLRVKEAYQIEVVAPSNRMYEKARERDRQNLIQDFMQNVSAGLHKALDIKGIQLPSIFSRCENFQWRKEPWMDEEDFTRPPNSWNQKYHFDCANCTHGFNIVGLSPEEFFEKYHKDYIKFKELTDSHYGKRLFGELHTRYVSVKSKAERVPDDEDIWVAAPNFGHHSSGVDLELIKAEDNPPNCDVLFYFRKKQELDLSEYNKIISLFLENKKKITEDKREQQAAKKLQEEQKEAQKLISIFQ